MATTDVAVDERTEGAPGRFLARALDYDLSAPVAFAAFAAVYLLVRIPWMRLGYGTDPDAWRVALTGKYLWEDGAYWPSRLPGYPLHEFVTALFVQLPHASFWSNLVTAVASLAGVWIFARLVVHLRLPLKSALVVGFAFAPLLWINSTATMDYMWALSFLMAAYLFAIKKNAAAAGIAIGIAAGFRLSSLAMLLPLGFYMWRTAQPRQHLRGFVVGALATSIIAYMPVLVRYGLGMFNFYDQKVDWVQVVRILGKEGLGVIGSLAVMLGLLLSLPRLRFLPRDAIRDPHVGTWLLAIVVFGWAFGRLPHEVAYLIPIFPFGFFLMSRYYYPAVLVPVIGVILLAGFVDFTKPGEDLTRQAVMHARPGKGLLLSDLDTMRYQRAFADEIAGDEIAPRTYVMTGFIYPQFVVRNWDRLNVRILERDMDAISMLSDRGEAIDASRDVHYVWLLTYDTFQLEKDRGYAFTYVPDAARSTLSVFGYRPGYFGGKPLSVSRASPSDNRAGSAETDR